MPYSEAQKRATAKYVRANSRRVNVILSRKYDADIISKIESVGNIQQYIKTLVRADIAREKSENMKEDKNMETYRIKQDKLTMWGSNADENTTLTRAEVEDLAREWEKPAEELLDDLIPVNPCEIPDPGVPSGGNPWYAVQRDPSDDWSAGSFDLEEAKALARKYRDDPDYGAEDPLIAVIDNALEHPFCTEEIRDFD
jgi:hypothetical protein